MKISEQISFSLFYICMLLLNLRQQIETIQESCHHYNRLLQSVIRGCASLSTFFSCLFLFLVQRWRSSDLLNLLTYFLSLFSMLLCQMKIFAIKLYQWKILSYRSLFHSCNSSRTSNFSLTHIKFSYSNCLGIRLSSILSKWRP